MTSVPKDTRIFVAGHAGLVGSAVLRKLEAEGFTTLLDATNSTCATRRRSSMSVNSPDGRPPERANLWSRRIGGSGGKRARSMGCLTMRLALVPGGQLEPGQVPATTGGPRPTCSRLQFDPLRRWPGQTSLRPGGRLGPE